ncbi:GNAT family N-acetyltransferase [Sediminibacillus albus]|uniref:Ribosomal-protein-serine acetyltransferase n=1 Tax=Sediminibacillus albus TaxID=407036 RepID=A0A1G8WZI5_9BACI|nr:GNAT family protein [Sediminibacillus albus]SDJ83631.1 ribosomal-protein-serine acetyltransferase [Sediminibacillus albus]
MFTYDIDKQTSLKMLDLQDAEALYSLTMDSMDRLKKWLPLITKNKEQSDTEAFIQSTMKQFSENNGFQAGIWHQGRIAGVIGFHQVNWHNKNTSIGYWLGEGFEGLGLMTKACEAFTSYAFHGLHLNRVEIRAAEENKKSRAIPERLGFTVEGKIRQGEWLHDHYVDHIVYSMLAEEWKDNKQRQ